MTTRLYHATVLALSLAALGIGGFAARPEAQAAPPVVNQSADPLLKSFRFRSIGPASMGGRIDDIAVSETNPNIIYLGYAVGGVFKSENNGVTFEPVFDRYATASIGDIAIHPTNPNIVYVGTGEPNNRQTSSFGDGIYKTTDGGKTFTQHRPQGDADDRAHRHRPEESRDRLRRVAGPPVRAEHGTRRLQDDRRRQDLEPDQVHRPRHGLHRHRAGSGQHEHRLRGELPAPAPRLLLQRRRAGQRDLEDHRCGQDVDTSSTAADCRRARTAASRSTSRARIPTSSTRKSKRVTSAGRRRRPWRSSPRATEATPAGRRGRHAAGGAPEPVRGRGGARQARSPPQPAARAAGTRRRAAAVTTGATTPDPGAGFGGGGGAAAGRRGPQTPPALDPVARRHLPLREQGPDVDAREQLQLASDVLQPDPRRPVERQDGLRRRACRSRSRSTAARRS